MALLDTTVLVDLLRKPAVEVHRRAAEKTAGLRRSGQTLTTTRLNVAELFVGVELSTNPHAEAERVEELLERIVILELDEMAARRFGNIAAHLRKHGLPSGNLDTLIAAIALVNGQAIVTRNVKHFSTIPGLAIDSY